MTKKIVFAPTFLLLSGCMDAAHKPLAQLTLAELGGLLIQIALSLAVVCIGYYTIVEGGPKLTREWRNIPQVQRRILIILIGLILVGSISTLANYVIRR